MVRSLRPFVITARRHGALWAGRRMIMGVSAGNRDLCCGSPRTKKLLGADNASRAPTSPPPGEIRLLASKPGERSILLDVTRVALWPFRDV